MATATAQIVRILYPRSATPRQAQFLDHVRGGQYRYIGFGGAMGGGKSAALAFAGLVLSVLYPGNLGLVARRDFSDLRTTTYQEFLDTIPSELIEQHHKSEHWIDIKTRGAPSRVMFGELKDPESYKSLNLGWFGIDEATEVSRDGWLMLLSRLRRPGIPPAAYKALAATNPGPGWFRDLFVRNPDSDHVFVPSLPRDNPHLPPTYEADLRKVYPELWVQRLLDGNWNVFEGQVFTEWDQHVHIIDPFDPPPQWPVWAGLDYGSTNPAACIWLTRDPDGNTYAFREYYQKGRTPHDQAADIVAMGAPPLIYGDPATRAKTLERQGIFMSVMDQWREGGLNVVSANNEIMAGLMLIKTLLTCRPDQYFPRTGLAGSPRMFVTRNCWNLIREVEGLAWQRPRSDDVNAPEKPVDARDHAIDAARYGIMGGDEAQTPPLVASVATSGGWSPRSGRR